MILSFLSALIYPLLEAIREGWAFESKSRYPWNPKTDPVPLILQVNEHPLFTLQRSFVYALILCLLWEKTGPLNACLQTAAFLCWFTFLHDGVYYCIRNYYNPNIYKERFFDVDAPGSPETENTAKSESLWTWHHRLFLALFGVFLYLLSILNLALWKIEL